MATGLTISVEILTVDGRLLALQLEELLAGCANRTLRVLDPACGDGDRVRRCGGGTAPWA